MGARATRRASSGAVGSPATSLGDQAAQGCAVDLAYSQRIPGDQSRRARNAEPPGERSGPCDGRHGSGRRGGSPKSGGRVGQAGKGPREPNAVRARRRCLKPFAKPSDPRRVLRTSGRQQSRSLVGRRAQPGEIVPPDGYARPREILYPGGHFAAKGAIHIGEERQGRRSGPRSRAEKRRAQVAGGNRRSLHAPKSCQRGAARDRGIGEDKEPRNCWMGCKRRHASEALGEPREHERRHPERRKGYQPATTDHGTRQWPAIGAGSLGPARRGGGLLLRGAAGVPAKGTRPNRSQPRCQRPSLTLWKSRPLAVICRAAMALDFTQSS